jgi:hypothetical protein
MMTNFTVTFLTKLQTQYTNILNLNLNQKGCRIDVYFWYVDLHILTKNIFLTLLTIVIPYMYPHSFILLSKASSKASSPQSGIGCSSFHFQYPFFSLISSSSCLRLFHRLPVTYICPSIFPSITYFRRQFLRKMWPIQLTSLHFIVYSISFLPWLFVIVIHFSQDRSKWSYLSFPCTKFQNFTDISDLFSVLSKFQHHTKLYSKCNTVLVSAPYKVILQM